MSWSILGVTVVFPVFFSGVGDAVREFTRDPLRELEAVAGADAVFRGAFADGGAS